jgi:hypothetical protein
MRIEAAFEGRLDELLRQEAKVLLRATNSGVRRTTTILQRELRRDVKSAGLGKLVNSVRRSVKLPRGGKRTENSVEGFVYSSADYKRAGGKVDILLTYEQGGSIQPLRKQWLAVPLDGVGRGRGGRGGANARLRPEDFPQGSLYFRPTRNPKVALLVLRARYGNNGVDQPMFLLIKQSRVKPRFSRRRADAAAQSELFNLIAEAYERFGRKAGIIDDGES